MKNLKLYSLAFLLLTNTAIEQKAFANTNNIVLYCSPTVYCKNHECKLSVPSAFNMRSNMNNAGTPDGIFYFWQADTDGWSNGGNCLYVNNYNGGALIGYSLNPSLINVGANITITPENGTNWSQQGNNLYCVGNKPSDAYKCSWNLLGSN